MFQALDDRTARRHDGVCVEVLDDGVRYRVGDRVLLVPVEYVYDDEAVLVLYGPALGTWEVPHALEAIGTIERVQILAEISEALTVLGVKHRVVA
jgi:hypothetical protein